mmetsp:Transcript_800/g.2257  ORF Transcript_800/g.2257 Transcript_800/m.2257 type:complete len:211 (+) Transcript_800:2-634(+)
MIIARSRVHKHQICAGTLCTAALKSAIACSRPRRHELTTPAPPEWWPRVLRGQKTTSSHAVAQTGRRRVSLIQPTTMEMGHMLKTMLAPGTVYCSDEMRFGRKAAKSFQTPYISIRKPQKGQPMMITAMPVKNEVVPFHFSLRKKNLKTFLPIKRERPRRKATFPSARRVRSKSSMMPMPRQRTPRPQHPMPIFLLSSNIAIKGRDEAFF